MVRPVRVFRKMGYKLDTNWDTKVHDDHARSRQIFAQAW